MACMACTKVNRTGRGRVVMRARTREDIPKSADRQAIIVDEIPYQVNKKTSA